MESIAHCLSAIRRSLTPEIHPAQHLTSDITTSNETPFASMGAHYFAKLSIQLMKTERVNAIFLTASWHKAVMWQNGFEIYRTTVCLELWR